MKNLRAFAFLLLLSVLCVGVNAQTSTTVPFYIVIGQSNTGWTSANGMNSQQASLYKGLIQNTEIWNPAVGAWSATWQPMNVGVNTMPENYADRAMFGPEASLLKSLQLQESKKRLVFKQGQGGTNLASDWRPTQPGQYLWQAGVRWQQFVSWLDLAVSQANAKGYKLDLKAIIWMQGEDDALTLDRANAYLTNLNGFFASIQNIWDGYVSTYQYPTTDYKKVIGRIYAPTSYPFRDIVRTAQAAYCANPANNAVMINCDSYPLQDWVHYNATGQIQFGMDIYNSAQFEGPATVPSGISFSGKVFLQGAYSSSTGKMHNALNTSGILQAFAVKHPYNSTVFSHSGTEKVASNFFAANTDIVDWVLIELRNASDPLTVVAKRAALVKQDGTLVDTDGSNTQIIFEGVPSANYFVAIRHRNHLGIRSATALDFSTGSANYDFTTSAGKCYQSLNYSSTVQMGSAWVMRGGNANLNTNVKYNGPLNDQDRIQNQELGGSISLVLSNIYAGDDVNMDGVIKTNGPNNDQNFLLNIVLEGLLGTVINEQL